MKPRERKLDWRLSGDPFQPWEATVDGARWRVRIHDFPEEGHVYSLLVDGQVVEEFNDWPATWSRPPLPDTSGAGPGRAFDDDDPVERRDYELEAEQFERTKNIPPSKLVKMLRARSVAEERVYMELHPCACGSVLWTYTQKLDVDRDRVVSRFGGTCKMCGAPRSFEFERTSDEVSTDDPRRYYGGATPSEIVDPGEWLIIADKRARVVPSSPDRTPGTLAVVRKVLLEAAAAVEEARKFIPRGASEVPESAFRSPRGRAVRAADPGRFKDAPLEAEAAKYAEIRARFAERSGPGGPRFGAGELGAVGVRVAAARAKRPRPRPTQVSIDFRPGTYLDYLSRAVASAHAAWLERGRTGDGRLVLSRAKLTGAPARAAKIPAARFESCKLSKIDLSVSTLSEAELIDCLCDKASFRRAYLDGALLERCVLFDADLRLADLPRSKIVLCDLGLANLDRADLDGAQVEDSSFEGALIGDAKLDRAVFVDCDFRDTDLSRREPRLPLCSTTDTWFIRCDFRGARLDGRRLAGTVFESCRFRGVQGQPALEAPITVHDADVDVLAIWRTPER
jgi:uncharacterized protein YjbI with pentapeptide repeats